MNTKTEERNLQQNLGKNQEMLTFSEACAYLKVSKSFLYKATSARSIPFFKPAGKILRFNRHDLDRWLQQNRFASKDELMYVENEKGGTK